VTLAVYWPVTRHQFIDFDDYQYIVDNGHVTGGLNWADFVWAFTNTEAANWHPLTWLSHQLDCQWFGLNPGGHHLVSVFFHTANALLLFLFLRHTTGALWRSAFVAALFAWHPLRVESVAWAAERKDVLCAFFWLLTLIAYARYAAPGKANSRWFYALALGLSALSLLSKPMAVTLPFALLLLDLWPLNRWDFNIPFTRNVRRLLPEKIPFLLLAATAAAVTFLAQKYNGAVSPLPPSTRLMNAIEAYPRYIVKFICPTNLSIVYPYRYDWPVIAVAGAALAVLTISFLALKSIRQTPWFFTSWFWFLGTLIPTIGLVQVGAASMADRYTYLPEIGLAIMVAWAAELFIQRRPGSKNFIVPAGGAALAICLAMTSIQISYWRVSISLFLHAVKVTDDNYVAENGLAMSLEKIGRHDDALQLYRDAVRIEPRYAVSQFNLANELLHFGKRDEALTHFQAAVDNSPHDPVFQFDLGLCQLQAGRTAAAVDSFNSALRDQPQLVPAHFHLAQALAKLGRFSEAATQYRETLKLKPDYAGAKNELAALLAAHPELH